MNRIEVALYGTGLRGHLARAAFVRYVRQVTEPGPWLNECMWCGEMHAVAPEWRAPKRKLRQA